MGSIHILDDTVINKIAAGEVVERPASVIKELVENAIDAQATNIKIELEDGGKKLITIQDDGCGVGYNDLKLILKRHATSKITTLGELFSVHSMGFRGEALSSISAVSRFTLLSKQPENSTGHKLTFENSKKEEITTWHGANGTYIRIEDIFYNVPVRKKFLRSSQAEYSHCLETLQALALAYPKHSFSLKHNGKIKFDAQSNIQGDNHWLRGNEYILGEPTIQQRASQIFGKELAGNLLYVCETNEYGSIEALISPPGIEKATTKNMFFFVNGRWIKEQILRYGFLRGYHSHLLKGRYPQVLCYLRMDPALIDVNVHPSKTQLRFQYTDEVQGLIARAVRERLRKGDWINPSPEVKTFSVEDNRTQENITPVFNQDKKNIVEQLKRFAAPSVKATSYKNSGLFQASPPRAIQSRFTNHDHPTAQKAAMHIDWDQATFIGTYSSCYLMFEMDKKLLLVDQHAFHERILYENLFTNPSLYKDSQPLIVPELIELEPTSIAVLLEKKYTLKENGFKFKIVHDKAIEIQEVPIILAGRNIESIFQDLGKEDSHQSTQDICSPLLATMACHSAIRAGEELSEDKLTLLLEQAKQVDFYQNCPHGRRVLKWLQQNEIERWFDRI